MAGLSLDHPWAFTFGILGNIISFMVYLAPLPTFYRVYKKKSTEGFQSVPYVVALFSAMLWIYYAFIKADAYLLVTINSIGCVIETMYIVMYLSYAPKKARIFTAQVLLLLNVGLFGLIVLVTLMVAKGPERVHVLGWVCVSFSISVFVAPLSIIRLVIRTKSVEFMPFWLSFFLTMSAIAWFSYGLLTKDIYVALPNILGFIFGVVQMGIYIAYKGTEKVAYDHQKVAEHIITITKVGTSERTSEVHPIDVIGSPAVHGEENADKEGQERHEPTNDGDMENMEGQKEIEMNQLEV
ncbi:bidirectional sugar transporter SWEET14 isoform X2 [Elaeis guineensis]|uniref:Bidirectional sugar transporter SWEET n=2 Tax=Elaeis guineensis var. tenera TaxID=51953 RepID=A0A6I9RP50_ELAGV|nr:bidirectional sugar transporter SWEET14 [Elaeis guineensis]